MKLTYTKAVSIGLLLAFLLGMACLVILSGCNANYQQKVQLYYAGGKVKHSHYCQRPPRR